MTWWEKVGSKDDGSWKWFIFGSDWFYMKLHM